MRVRVTGFPRRAVAALFDLGLLLALTAAVTTTVALALGVPMPGLREVGPDLLVAGILDRNPMAVGAVGLFLGMTGLYQLYFGGMSGQTPGMRLVGIRLISRARRRARTGARPAAAAGAACPACCRPGWAGCGRCSIASTARCTITWPAAT